MTKHQNVVFDEPFLHGPLESLSSLLSSDDSHFASTELASSSLARSLLNDSQLVVVDLSTSPFNVDPLICTLSTSSIVTR